MILARHDESRPAKGWYSELFAAGPVLPAIGFANAGINERHYHRALYEVYLIVRGDSTMILNDQRIRLHAGDVLVVEPGEVHTFVGSSPDYFHFVLQCPRPQGRTDKVPVP
ncbi:MAG: cupin domain-containing protein [Chloroflexota bacterium]|nr:cupin domain-containing protein [Chloroflexota bacterium]